MATWRPRTFMLMAVAGALISLIKPVFAGFGIGDSGVSQVVLYIVAGVGFVLLYVGIRFAMIRRREIAAESSVPPGEGDSSR